MNYKTTSIENGLDRYAEITGKRFARKHVLVPGKYRDLVDVRQFLCCYLQALPSNFSQPQIADMLCLSNHTSVLYALRRGHGHDGKLLQKYEPKWPKALFERFAKEDALKRDVAPRQKYRTGPINHVVNPSLRKHVDSALYGATSFFGVRIEVADIMPEQGIRLSYEAVQWRTWVVAKLLSKDGVKRHDVARALEFKDTKTVAHSNERAHKIWGGVPFMSLEQAA